MTEFDLTVKLAEKTLNEPWIDPDSDECMLARQFLRLREAIGYAATSLQQSDTPPPIVVKDIRGRLFAAIGCPTEDGPN